ncbi:MAG TPA: hypothetical protein DCM54_06515 [Gammaproteobacteria bacterium]|nr:hypothetical protein [Gammaproteobacteria bacterium]|tara:strand:+ start:1283 stop:1714 length:432 start_codon:yes stop_codon:yes gene_type:complete
MFNATLELPLWLIIVLATGCIYAVVMSALIPGIKWFFRRRLNRAIERINERLRIQIRPFQRTKRQVLIDRLIYDSQIIFEIENEAMRSDVSREILQARVYNYARQIIPARDLLSSCVLDCSSDFSNDLQGKGCCSGLRKAGIR